MAGKATGSAAKTMSLNIVGESRGVKQGSRNTVEMTQEVYDKLSYSNQTLVALHEKFIGAVDEAVSYTSGFGLTIETVDALVEKFGL